MLVIALGVAAYSYLIRPVVNATPIYTQHKELNNDTILAYSIGKMIASRGKNPIKPNSDKPKVGDTCPQCDGTGREPGDGTVDISCGQCRGDGRVDPGDPILVDGNEIKPLSDPLNEPDPIDPTIEDTPQPQNEIEPQAKSIRRITVNIEGIVYTYDPSTGYFYMPDRSRILSIPAIPSTEISEIKAIQTCDEASGLCREYLLLDE
jgi:hypothetical protein